MSESLELLLASTSPYRKALLERLRIPFRCVSPEVDEEAYKRIGHSAGDLSEALARAKAVAVGRWYPHAVVIGSDQVAALEGRILGKPGSAEGARTQLAMLSGHMHQLHTAVALAHGGRIEVYRDVTRLQMRHLTPDEIDRYVAVDDPQDCAGSYKIESLGLALFEAITSIDQTAIIGLPLLELASRLRNLGFAVP